jgi:hypothetical protein
LVRTSNEPEQEPIPTISATDDSAAVHLNEEPQFEKVHIRGVDELTTDDLKQFARDHFKQEEPCRIEWIDDTSANLVYSSAEIGLQALAEFTQQHFEEDSSALPSLRLRTAKTLSNYPESVLQVRTAVKTDRKKHRAHEASRFYLMHPEHDPRERMRREFSERRQGQRNDSVGEYRRRRFDDREHRRRKDLAGDDDFNASMYDDNQESDQGRRELSEELSSGEGKRTRSTRARRNNGDLFPEDSGHPRGRLRNRSASPEKAEFSQDDRVSDGDSRSRRRFRNRSPLPNRDQDLFSRVNSGKELFPSGTRIDGSNRRELFPNKVDSTYLKKELFPNKTNISNHRRSDAFDAADETADIFSKRMAVPFVDGSTETGGVSTDKDIELFPDSGAANEIKIRGTSQDQGISIRGASNGISIKGTASVRELFPSKYNVNEGKELFSDKLEGRGGRRKKAEDMFY